MSRKRLSEDQGGDRVAHDEEERATWWTDQDSDAAWECWRGGGTATRHWKNNEIARCKELQQDETHEGKKQLWSGDPVNEKLVETDDGERRTTWRDDHGNVAVWRDDRGSTMWKYEHEYDYENIGARSNACAEQQLWRTVVEELDVALSSLRQ